jgi:hypothetical protein
MLELLSVKKSTKPEKKYMATFLRDGRTITTHFGDSGAPDYTLTGDETRRKLYRMRHKKDLETGDPSRAGFLSYYILWGDSTSVQENIKSYKRRFNL